MLREGLFHLVCFHAQQAAEKGLKAHLVFRRKTVPRAHHLVDLLQHCVREGLRGRGLDAACKILDQYYLPTRYPDALVGSLPEERPSRVHASEAIRLAERILRAVKRAMKSSS